MLTWKFHERFPEMTEEQKWQRQNRAESDPRWDRKVSEGSGLFIRRKWHGQFKKQEESATRHRDWEVFEKFAGRIRLIIQGMDILAVAPLARKRHEYKFLRFRKALLVKLTRDNTLKGCEYTPIAGVLRLMKIETRNRRPKISPSLFIFFFIQPLAHHS